MNILLVAILSMTFVSCQLRNGNDSSHSKDDESGGYAAGSTVPERRACNPLEVIDLAQRIPVNEFDRHYQIDTASRGKEQLIGDNEEYAQVYASLIVDSGADRLRARVSADSSVLHRKYKSSAFLIKVVGNLFSRPSGNFYSIIFYDDKGGVAYSIGVIDTNVKVVPITRVLRDLIVQVANKHPRSSHEWNSDGEKPAIVSFVTEGEPQVLISQHAFPYHTRPKALIWSSLSKDEVEERRLVDSMIQSIMEVSGLHNVW